MPYKLRFVQRFAAAHQPEFLDLERRFAQLEKETPEFPRGRRYRPYIGGQPTNTLVWECEFADIQGVTDTLAFLEKDTRHEDLLRQQRGYIVDFYTEVYELLDY